MSGRSDDDREAKFARKVLDSCLKSWPELKPFVSASAEPLSRGFRNTGVCTHSEFADDFYVHSRGGKKFILDAAVPPSFQWIGIQYTGSEYFFAMWRERERWFWFYDQYMRPFTKRALEARVRERLSVALEKWKAGAEDIVVYSGPWGWFDPATGFETDEGVHVKEMWDARSPGERREVARETITRVVRSRLRKPQEPPESPGEQRE